ncbi:MAG: ATP-grasp domain-containing protein [Phycisphaeraceae bacterium]
MAKNIFVLGLEDYARRKLEHIKDADQYAFHPLLDYEAIVKPASYDFDALLTEADETLRDFPGSVDGIITHWDFPATELLPILCQRHNLPGPTLESVLKCGHKYWSRLEQSHCVPEHTPHFQAVNPFSEDAFGIKLDYPFWIKPVKAFASSLGFKINSSHAFNEAIHIIRANIRRIGEPFNQALRYAEIPGEVDCVDGTCCIVENIIGGRQGALEGYVVNGEVHIHSALDMLREPGRSSFYCFFYPSQLPTFVLDQVEDATRRFVKHVGLDNTVFNIEFFWDEKAGRIWLIEINPRMSQSHTHFFTQVDGASNHQIAVALAQGQDPQFPHRQGRYNFAGKFMWRKYVEDAYVTEVPSREEIEALERAMPGTEIYIQVDKHARLSELRDQDPYSYELAIILTAADTPEALHENFERCKEGLTFRFEPTQALREIA